MKINYILKKLLLEPVKYNHEVNLIVDNSKECCFNSVFFACKGFNEDGKYYIEEAISNGAKTIITDNYCIESPLVNYIYLSNPKRLYSLMLKIFYKNISNKMNIIGVIGTNAKTTITTIGYKFFNSIHKKSMLIGSNGIYYSNKVIKTDNTTPNIGIIYKYLNIAKRLHINYVFMEVSSISVSEYRCLGLEFKVLIYTNFSQDHLDYHKDMEKYFLAKCIPFIRHKGISIINIDDSYSEKIIEQTSNKIITYGIKNGIYRAIDSSVNIDGISFKYLNYNIKSKMLGGFNIYNILSIIPLCDIYKINIKKYQKFLVNFNGVEGRMERIIYDNKSIIIDYAHTLAAVENAINNTLNLTWGKLYIILGCGGNRDRKKRKDIGRFLNDYSEYTIITSDNPRNENPKDIIDDILSGMNNKPLVIENRKEAIIYALNLLKENDCLLILGKGAENYIDLNGVKYKYSDKEVCYEWINEQ